MRVQILLNRNERESFLHGYKDGDPMMRVYDANKGVAPTTIVDLLEVVFKENQHLDGSKPWYGDCRSLSVGDVVCIGESAWAVERVGFKELEDFEVPA